MRCGLCGSKKVSLVNKNSYSYKKGITGAVLLGPVGAVAGINGNSSMVYHCMECGQDSLRVMSDYIEQGIDEALRKRDRERLDSYRMNWKNIEFPSYSSFTEDRITGRENARGVANQTKNDIRDLSMDELKDLIKQDVSTSAIPYKEEEIERKYKDNINVYDAIKNLRKEGACRITYVNDTAYIETAKTVEDIRQFALIYKAETMSIESDYWDEIKDIISKNVNITESKVTDEFAVRHPEVAKNDNPYLLSTIVSRVLKGFIKTGEIVCSDGAYRISTLGELEETIRKNIIKIAVVHNTHKYNRIKIENGESDDRIDSLNAVIDVLNNSVQSVSAEEVSNQIAIPNISKYKCAALLKRLVDDGKVIKETGKYGSKVYSNGRIEKYKHREISRELLEDVSILHEDRDSKHLLSILTNHENQEMSLEEIGKQLIGKEKSYEGTYHCMEVALRELLILKTEGAVEERNTSEGSKWTFCDPNKDKVAALTEEKERLLASIPILQKELEEIKKESEANIKRIDNTSHSTNKELEETIKEGDERIDELTDQIMKAQGFINKHKRQKLTQELEQLQSELEKKKNQLKREKYSQKAGRSTEIARYKEPVKNAENKLLEYQNRVTEIQKEISMLSKYSINPQDDDSAYIEDKDKIDDAQPIQELTDVPLVDMDEFLRQRQFISVAFFKEDGTVMLMCDSFINDVDEWDNFIIVSLRNRQQIAFGKDGNALNAWGDSFPLIKNWNYSQIDYEEILKSSVAIGIMGDGRISVLNEGKPFELDKAEKYQRISVGKHHICAVTKDHSVESYGDNSYGQCNTSGWTDVVMVSAGLKHTVGLCKDGTVLATGSNSYGQCDVGDWKSVMYISCGDYHTIGLKEDCTTVIAIGNNNMGQCNIGLISKQQLRAVEGIDNYSISFVFGKEVFCTDESINTDEKYRHLY